jgi:sensor histidine kinase regulating citrate/malate metabolism
MKKLLNRKSDILIAMILGQSLVVIINGVWGYIGLNLPIKISMGYITTFSLIAGGILSAIAIYLLKEIFRLCQREREAELDTVRLKESMELIDVLRTNRHDFLNHIQVVYSLAQLGKIDSLASYIDGLNHDMEAEARLSRLAQPELAAFLIKKASFAVDQGIKFEIGIETDLVRLRIPPIDIVRVLGNLIDNAFYAVRELKPGEKRVRLTITEESGCHKISVCNNGPEIPETIAEKIFAQGFSTKGCAGSGLGLYITRQLLEKHRGKIVLTEMPCFSTCFEIIIPGEV